MGSRWFFDGVYETRVDDSERYATRDDSERTTRGLEGMPTAGSNTDADRDADSLLPSWAHCGKKCRKFTKKKRKFSF